MRHVETALAVLVIAGLTYFAFAAAGGEYPLNVAIAALAFVVALILVLRVLGRRAR